MPETTVALFALAGVTLIVIPGPNAIYMDLISALAASGRRGSAIAA